MQRDPFNPAAEFDTLQKQGVGKIDKRDLKLVLPPSLPPQPKPCRGNIDAGLMCPRPMSPRPKILGCCTP
jgi:hypothetical protein